MNWNIKLKARRISLELSRLEVAKLIGVNTTTYGRWERGEHMPLPAYRKLIGQAFQVNEIEIFGQNKVKEDDYSGQDISTID